MYNCVVSQFIRCFRCSYTLEGISGMVWKVFSILKKKWENIIRESIYRITDRQAKAALFNLYIYETPAEMQSKMINCIAFYSRNSHLDSLDSSSCFVSFSKVFYFTNHSRQKSIFWMNAIVTSTSYIKVLRCKLLCAMHFKCEHGKRRIKELRFLRVDILHTIENFGNEN